MKSNLPLLVWRQVYNQCILAVQTYGSDTWSLTNDPVQISFLPSAVLFPCFLIALSLHQSIPSFHYYLLVILYCIQCYPSSSLPCLGMIYFTLDIWVFLQLTVLLIACSTSYRITFNSFSLQFYLPPPPPLIIVISIIFLFFSLHSYPRVSILIVFILLYLPSLFLKT